MGRTKLLGEDNAVIKRKKVLADTLDDQATLPRPPDEDLEIKTPGHVVAKSSGKMSEQLRTELAAAVDVVTFMANTANGRPTPMYNVHGEVYDYFVPTKRDIRDANFFVTERLVPKPKDVQIKVEDNTDLASGIVEARKRGQKLRARRQVEAVDVEYTEILEGFDE